MSPKIRCVPLPEHQAELRVELTVDPTVKTGAPKPKIAVIGAGLAGSEAAYTLAEGYGALVHLYEMKKHSPTPAQDSPSFFAELVCSNSLKSESLLNPCGVLKNEMRALGSLVLSAAEEFKVPAGEALAVERVGFATRITNTLRNHKNIQVFDEIVHSVSNAEFLNRYDHILVCTGPLTQDNLANDLKELTGSESLYFYDAIAPILDGHTIDWNLAFRADRMSFSERGAWLKARKNSQLQIEGGKDIETSYSENQIKQDEENDADYVNLPLNKEEYEVFVAELLAAKKVPFHNFESPKFFNGCQPIEVLAESGPRTLSFGPMKARGLVNPKTGFEPYACVQLRKESRGDASFNMVGFQTRMTWGEQKRVFQKIPALANAEFHRMGTMHRNTYMVSPQILNSNFCLKAQEKISLAGQLMGVEGYVESAAMGILMAHAVGFKLQNKPFTPPPNTTALGVLAEHVLHCEPKHFSPMNIHWGLFPPPQNHVEETEFKNENRNENELRQKKHKPGKQERRQILSERAIAEFAKYLEANF